VTWNFTPVIVVVALVIGGCGRSNQNSAPVEVRPQQGQLQESQTTTVPSGPVSIGGTWSDGVRKLRIADHGDGQPSITFDLDTPAIRWSVQDVSRQGDELHMRIVGVDRTSGSVFAQWEYHLQISSPTTMSGRITNGTGLNGESLPESDVTFTKINN
jgi:hypothetical protein